jgi:cytochrome P450
VAARRRVDRALYAEIARRRAEAPADGGASDVLGMLLAPGDGDGGGEGVGLSDAELRDQTLSLISAGFDTTAAALTWCLAMASEHEAAGARLREALADGDPASAQRQPYVDAFVKETLRLRPPAAAALRRTVREVDVAGFRVPRRQRVALSILLTHRDPEVFPDPARFDPGRFADGDPPPFAYVPFGYGVRHCIGAGTATALVKAGLALTLGRYATRPVRPGPYRPVGMTLHPAGGFPATVTPAGAGERA